MIGIICLVVIVFADNFPELNSSKVNNSESKYKVVMSPILFIRSSKRIEKRGISKIVRLTPAKEIKR
jgi:hypothetical protein